MSTIKPITLTLTRAQAGTVVLALVADVRKWSADPSAGELLTDAWDALEAVNSAPGTAWLHDRELPGDTLRQTIARTYSLPMPPVGV